MVDNKKPKQRTLAQNRALHLLLTQLSNELNEQGLTMMRVLSKNAEIEWTDYAAKEYLLRPFIQAMYGKRSTKSLTTKELSAASEAMLNHVAKVTGVALNFPSIEDIINQQRMREQ